MLQRILDWDTIRGRDDFYMYVIGYAEFFSAKPGSEWCNDASFGVLLNFETKLTQELREKLNELVRDVNSVLEKSVKDLNNDRVRFFNPSALFGKLLFDIFNSSLGLVSGVSRKINFRNTLHTPESSK